MRSASLSATAGLPRGTRCRSPFCSGTSASCPMRAAETARTSYLSNFDRATCSDDAAQTMSMVSPTAAPGELNSNEYPSS